MNNNPNSIQPNQYPPQYYPQNAPMQMPAYQQFPTESYHRMGDTLLGAGAFSHPVICKNCFTQTYGVLRRIVSPLCTACGILFMPIGFLICWLGGSKVVPCCHNCMKPIDPGINSCFSCSAK